MQRSRIVQSADFSTFRLPQQLWGWDRSLAQLGGAAGPARVHHGLFQLLGILQALRFPHIGLCSKGGSVLRRGVWMKGKCFTEFQNH